MAKISNSTILSPNDYAGENENFYSLLAVLTSLFNDIGNGFKNNLTFDENIDSELIEYEFTDLVPATLKIKTKFRKTEIISVNAESEIVVGYNLKYSTKNEYIITIKFNTPGAKNKCRVRLI